LKTETETQQPTTKDAFMEEIAFAMVLAAIPVPLSASNCVVAQVAY
jgi:hypothetical protein